MASVVGGAVASTARCRRHQPTVDTVRAALGDTGSKSPIGCLLKRWKAEHGDATAAAGAGDGLPVEMLAAVKFVHERVQTDAPRQVALARTEHQAALDAARVQLRQCQAHDGMLSQSAATLSAELAQKTPALPPLQETHHSDRIALTTLRSANAGMAQRLADRALEIKAVCEQLAQARVHFERFQKAIAAQRLEDRRAFDRISGRLEHDQAGTLQRLLAKQATLAQQNTRLGQPRADHDASAGEARVARKELAAVRAEREQLMRQLG